MSDKKQKKVVIVILVILVIFALLLVVLDRIVLNNEDSPNNPNNPSGPSDPSKPKPDPDPVNPTYPEVKYESFSILKDASEFFAVSSNINNYFNYVYEQDNVAVYSLLSRKYISANSINTLNAIVEDIPRDNPINYTATKIYSYDYNDYISVYYVYGEVTTDTSLDYGATPKTVKTYHMVILDSEKFLYSITPLKSESELETMLKTTEKDKLDVNLDKNIYNSFKFQNVSSDTIVSTYYYRFLNKLMYDKEEAYKMLNKNYKEKRFPDYQKFLTFVNSNIDDIGSSTILSYRFVSNAFNIYYVYNSNGDVFIFKENGIMQFEVYMDDKTVSI